MGQFFAAKDKKEMGCGFSNVKTLVSVNDYTNANANKGNANKSYQLLG